MSKIILMQGAAGSGKSTESANLKKAGYHVVSRDEIRNVLLGQDGLRRYFDSGMKNSMNIEEKVSTLERREIAGHLLKGHNLVIDNTNLRKKHVQQHMDLFQDAVASGAVIDNITLVRLNVPFEVLRERCDARPGKPISDEVLKRQISQLNSVDWNIRDFWFKGEFVYERTSKPQKWYVPKFETEPYIPQSNKPRAVIVDLDGTLAKRRILEKNGVPYMRGYYDDYEGCSEDLMDPFVEAVVRALHDHSHHIIFLSGRKEKARNETVKFLSRLGFDFTLIMRQDDDDRPDDEVKYEIFNNLLRDRFYIIGAMDDRDKVCAMWEDIGVPVLNRGSINEHF